MRERRQFQRLQPSSAPNLIHLFPQSNLPIRHNPSNQSSHKRLIKGLSPSSLCQKQEIGTKRSFLTRTRAARDGVQKCWFSKEYLWWTGGAGLLRCEIACMRSLESLERKRGVPSSRCFYPINSLLSRISRRESNPKSLHVIMYHVSFLLFSPLFLTWRVSEDKHSQ